MSYAERAGSVRSERQDNGGRWPIGIIAIIFAAMAFVGIAASSLNDAPRSAALGESSSTASVVSPARASRTAITLVQAAPESSEFPLSVPVGTPYPAPAEPATTGNPTDLTY